MKRAVPWRHIRAGLDYLPRCHDVPRHRHFFAYATLVFRGSYEQFAYAGRLRVEAGDVVIQPSLDCHADRMSSPDVVLMRLPWRRETGCGGVYRGVRIEMIRRSAERDLREAVALLESEVQRSRATGAAVLGWPDLLARAIAENPRLAIAEWSKRHGVRREQLSREFTAVYGTSASQFRGEWNARHAWIAVTGSNEPLCRIAADLGFSDQAHMTRAVRALTGKPPAWWRRAQLFNTRDRPARRVGA